MTNFLITFLLVSLIPIGILAFKLRQVNMSPDKKPFYLSLFWGLSSYIYDKSLFIMSRLSIPYKISSSKLYSQLRHLYPGENILFHYENLLISSISCFFLGYFAGVLLMGGIYFSRLSPVAVKTVDRPDFSSSEDVRNLIVSVDGEESDIDITIRPKQLSTAEILDIFDSLHDGLTDNLLGNNTSLNHVDSKLNFIYSISNALTKNCQVTVDWEVADNTLISYNGELIYENIPETGVDTVVYATLQLEKYDFTATKEFYVTLYPLKQTSQALLTEEINGLINDDISLQNETVTLPTESSFGKLNFYESPDEFPVIIFPLFFIILALIIYGKISNLHSQLQHRSTELLHDYPEIISKLTLLYCAGLNIQNSFRRIAMDYDTSFSGSRYAYEEIKLMLKAIDNGTSEAAAYNDFGHNCIHPCYIKLGTLLSQNLKRGSAEIYSLLEYEAMNSLQDKKAIIKISGEKASTKALLPMVLMLLVVFIMVIAPAFMSM